MTTIKEILRRKIFENQLILIDGWTFLHIGLFFLIGIFYPNRWGLVIGGMIIFEIMEQVLAKNISLFKESQKDTLNDLGFNILGYWAGQYYLANVGI